MSRARKTGALVDGPAQPDVANVVVTVAIALASAIGIALVQPSLARDLHHVKQREDVFLLPPPAELRVMTLGYRSAAADLLYAKLLVEYGIHWQEKRGFPDVTRYIDGILALEPGHAGLYQFVDTILLFTPTGGTEEDARSARRYLERGTRERKFDPEMWLRYGQFLAFLAPSFLKDENEIEQWRHDGALAITHAVEFGADAGRSLAAVSILRKAGDNRAAIAHLQRAYALADDEETRQQLMFKFQQLGASMMDNDLAVSTVQYEWQTRYPFLTRGAVLLIGPHRSPALCAGPSSYDNKKCPPDWPTAIRSR